MKIKLDIESPQGAWLPVTVAATGRGSGSTLTKTRGGAPRPPAYLGSPRTHTHREERRPPTGAPGTPGQTIPQPAPLDRNSVLTHVPRPGLTPWS